MNINFDSLVQLEIKLASLTERYAFLREENDFLISNSNKLQLRVSESEKDLLREKEKYRLLKIAKTIEGSKVDSRDTKKKINTLIREIDKCIVKLNQ